MVSGAQIRAGRGLLNWSSQDLANRSNVGWSTIKRFESSDGIPASKAQTLERVILTLEQAGIEFFGDPLTSPGVRLRRDKGAT